MSPPVFPYEFGCAEAAERIVPFLGGALPEEEAAALARHLDGCPGCSRRVDWERSFDRAVGERLRRTNPPAGLADRVRAALEREAPTVREAPWRWAFSSGTAAAAASVLLALLVLPFVGGGPAGGPAEAGPVRLVREAVVVDNVCDREGLSYAEQRACWNEDHLNGLRCKDGRTWAIVLTDGGFRSLVFDRELRGRRLLVEGEFHSASGSVRIVRWKEVGASEGPLSSGLSGKATPHPGFVSVARLGAGA
jgi:anti-sigma factor (TIGR02949 family)